MNRNLKRFYIILLIFLQFIFNFSIAFAEVENDFVIWDVKSNEFWDKVEKNDPDFNKKKQKVIDGSIEMTFNYDLIYTNLDECLKLALKNSLDLKIQTHTKQMSKWEYIAKLSEFLPNLFYNFTISMLDGEFLVGGIVPVKVHEVPIESDYGITWDTYNQGKTIFESKAKRREYKKQQYNEKLTKEQVILNTTICYYDLLGSKLELEILKVNLLETEEQLKYTKALHEIGQGTKYDVLRAQVEVSNAKQLLTTNLKNLRLKQAKLSDAIGVDIFSSIYPSEAFIDTVKLVDSKYDLNYLYKTALSERKDLWAKKQEIDILIAEKQSISTDFMPKIKVYYQGSDVGTARIGLRHNDIVALEVNLPVGGANLGVNTYARYKAAIEKINAAKLEYQNLKADIKQSLLNSYYESDAALSNIQLAKKEIEAADEGLKNAMARMSIGQATFLDVLQSQQDKTQARTNFLKYIIDYNKAQAQLLFETGTISVDGVLHNYSIPPIS